MKGSLVPMALFTYDVPAVGKLDGEEDITNPKMDARKFFHEATAPETSARWRTIWHIAIDKYLGGMDGCQVDWVMS